MIARVQLSFHSFLTMISPPEISPNLSSKAGSNASKSSSKIPSCPHEKIIDLYHKILPSLPQIQVWNGASEKNLRTRWKEDPQRQSLEFWEAFFEYIAKSEFLMGRVKDWSCDLMWIVRPTNFAKIINGAYHKGAKLTTALQDHNRRVLEDFIND